MLENSHCPHRHMSLKAAIKCKKNLDRFDGHARVIASDDGGVSWRCLMGNEVPSISPKGK